jgi:Zn-dependent peptidase ImmA (M78 family)
MAGKFKHGFKKQAEEMALEVRARMMIAWDGRLDPRELARHVGVPVFDLKALVAVGMPESSLRHLLGNGRKEFSAALFKRDGLRLIVANPVHSIGRQASNIVHEVAHLLLEHEPPEAVLEAGCRRWNEVMENEADWLAGELLVPRRAALAIARSGADVESSALRYGVSAQMMRWRLNHSGALKQAEREQVARNRRWPARN